MATYNGRRAPNMTEYLANLNSFPQSVPESSGGEFDDFSLLATTDFFDFDMGEVPNDFGTTANGNSHWNGQQTSNDFLNNDFNFTDFSPVPDLSNPGPSPDTSPISPNFPVAPNTGAQALNVLPNTNPTNPSTTSSSSSNPGSTNSSSARRKLSLSNPNLTLEDRTRFAAEEDKRRRNTAASARFRVKKKQREQALERTAKEMTEKTASLEKRVQELEMENQWLKGLITEKNDLGKEKVGEMWAKFVAEGGEEKEAKEEPTEEVESK